MLAARESYLAAAEPSWARRVTDWQLTGLLNLSAIISPRVFISDVHLGDNELIYKSYVNNSKKGLFAQIVELAEYGVVSPLLRDRTVRPHRSDRAIDISSFRDVYDSWKALDPSDAWISEYHSDQRGAYFRHLDEKLLNSAPIVRYDYAEVKKQFINDIRAVAFTDAASWFSRAMDRLTTEQRKQYDQIIQGDWFSLADLYSLLQGFGTLDVGLSSLLAHGLINEAAYSRYIGANLTGFDTDSSSTEESLWGAARAGGDFRKSVTREELLDHASAVINAPALSLLSSLTAAEIVEIRKLGMGYFDLAGHGTRLTMTTLPEFERQFIQETTEYWERACDYISSRHQSISMKPRKLALYLRELPAPLSKVGEDTFRFAISLAQEAAVGESSAFKNLISRTAQFIFLTDKEEMKVIRNLLPKGAWSRDKIPGLSNVTG